MLEMTALRDIPQQNIFRKGDTFVLFGELFGRGYVNGLLEEARKVGMNIVGMTVGRRDENMELRALNADELAEAEASLGGRVINVPLMAGFEFDAPVGELNPNQLLSDMTLGSWQEYKLDWAKIARCREVGIDRFSVSIKQAMADLDSLISEGSNVYFAHTMAGGIPKVKVFLAIANRIYKGRGERFMSSRALLDSDLGKLILMNFDEVTANTLGHLIEGSACIRARIERGGGQVRYSAYGYHGCEILIEGKYQWQTYSNYTQGLAKMRLESIANAAWERGIKVTVFNCPEIRTNSSDIFAGLELSLFPLLEALKEECGGAWAEEQWEICQSLLKDDVSLQKLLDRIAAYNGDATSQRFRNFSAWPMDNTLELAEVMIGTSDDISNLHKDRKNLITGHLSSLVLESVGSLMFCEMSAPRAPVVWINHDIIARKLISVHCPT